MSTSATLLQKAPLLRTLRSWRMVGEYSVHDNESHYEELDCFCSTFVVHGRKRHSDHGILKPPSTSANTYWQFEKERNPCSGEYGGVRGGGEEGGRRGGGGGGGGISKRREKEMKLMLSLLR